MAAHPGGRATAWLAATGVDGVPAAPTRAAPANADGARRQLTVMFCDLVGSTEMAERLDPEAFRDVLLEYQDACARVVKQLEGHIAQYLGDGILVYFGYPRALEDAALRAVLAGLDMVEAVESIRDEVQRQHNVDLAMRIGVHTGLVVLGDIGGGNWRQQDYVVGETPNVAARLQALAEPGTVVITASTYQLVKGYVHVVPLGQRELKGLSRPVEVFQVTGRTGVESRLEAWRWRRVRLVDREDEREQLSSDWTDAAAGSFRATLLVGEAGIGKSRVLECVRDLASEGGGAHVTLQCSPYHANSVLHPVARALEQQAAIASMDDSATRWEKLSKLAESVGHASAEEMQLLAGLLSIPLPTGAKEVDLSSEGRREQTFQLLTRWFESLASATPLLVAVEDVQWGDPSTLELLHRIVDARPNRTLLVLTSRPEGEASLGGAVPVLTLKPLEER
ncbi:MAG: AAA family ATPase, partial [Actinomycetota bacterium]|nr:AAA family ATPase [Actinomycetota bacterium]